MTQGFIKSFIAVIILIVIAAAAYWYFLFRPVTPIDSTKDGNSSVFEPLNRPGTGGDTKTSGSINDNVIPVSTSTNVTKTGSIKALRLLSDSPVGGFAASSTGTTTIMRWVDRGRGNIFETKGNSLEITTLSNTLLPRVYNSSWNKNMTAFIGAILEDDSETPTYIYSDIRARKIATTTKTSTSTPVVVQTNQNLAPYELLGKTLPEGTISYAVSPNKDKVFLLVNNGNGSTGYVANFDGSKITQLFTTPLTQINVEWPATDYISITTKGNASLDGYMYFVSPTKGTWTKVLGPIKGLSTRTSRDAKNIIYSKAGSNRDIQTFIYNVAKATESDASIRTLADKCVWGNFYKELVYCGVPFENVSASYPDDWYKGTVSTIDKIWQVNATTGETKLVEQLIGKAGRVIDAYNLGLDDKDNFLLFMNKYDLSLWSLDLVRSN
jgi:hypothetical protein